MRTLETMTAEELAAQSFPPPTFIVENLIPIGMNVLGGAGKIGKSHYGYGHPIQIADFVKSVRTRKPPFVTVRDAAEAPALVMKFYKAARQNSPKGPGGRKSKNIKDPNGPIY